jgi:hypothetical protein
LKYESFQIGRTERKPDDITDFPHQRVIPIPEMIAYPEGKYRPPSIPFTAGYYPYNMYLQKGKVIYLSKIYIRCINGVLAVSHRMVLGVMESAIKLRREIGQLCSMLIRVDIIRSAIARLVQMPHSAMEHIGDTKLYLFIYRIVARYYHSSYRGFYEIWGWMAFMGTTAYIAWNFYS